MQRRMSITIREYKFFRSFSQKFENWPKRKAEAIWRKMRERKIAGEYNYNKLEFNVILPTITTVSGYVSIKTKLHSNGI